MTQLIDKAALVAEIEKQRNTYISEPSKYKVLSRIISFIDTLEVKEVYLEKEIQDIFQRYRNGYNGLLICNKTDFSVLAKHFFELGLKAQKGE